MKKTIILAILCTAVSAGAYAQINKDAILLGGIINLSNTKSTTDNQPKSTISNNGLISLSAGKAIKANTVAGVYGAYGRSKAEDNTSSTSSYTYTSTSSNAGIFYRKYTSLGKKFYFFGEGAIGYEGTKQVNEGKQGSTVSTSTTKEDGGKIGITPGLSYQLFKKIQLEVLMPSFAAVRYGVSKADSYTGTSSSGHYFTLSSIFNNTALNGIAVGFRVVL